MMDALSRLSELRRPRMLLTAARIGADTYRREALLPRYFGLARLPRSAEALTRLMEIEAALDDSRRASDAGYSVVRHVEVMSAILGEARTLRQSYRPVAVAEAGPATV